MLLSPVLGMAEDGHNTTNQGPRQQTRLVHVMSVHVVSQIRQRPIQYTMLLLLGRVLQRQGQPLLVQSFNLEFTKSVFVATVSICIGSIMHLNRSLLVRCALLQLLFFLTPAAVGDATESSSRRSKRSVQHNRPGSQAPAQGGARNVCRHVVTDTSHTNACPGAALTGDGSSFSDTHGQGQPFLTLS